MSRGKRRMTLRIVTNKTLEEQKQIEAYLDDVRKRTSSSSEMSRPLNFRFRRASSSRCCCSAWQRERCRTYLGITQIAIESTMCSYKFVLPIGGHVTQREFSLLILYCVRHLNDVVGLEAIAWHRICDFSLKLGLGKWGFQPTNPFQNIVMCLICVVSSRPVCHH